MSGYQRHPVNQAAELVPGRVFTCTRCRVVWEVVEIPRPFIRPDLFVCGFCDQPEQLELAANPSTARTAKRQTRRHDPAIARIPYAHDDRTDWLSREPTVDEED